MTTNDIHEHYYKVLLTETQKILSSDVSDREKFGQIVRLSNTCASNLATESLDYANFQDLDLSKYEVESSEFRWHDANKVFFKTGGVQSEQHI